VKFAKRELRASKGGGIEPRSSRSATFTREAPTTDGRATIDGQPQVDELGVDRTLVRETLRMSPTERLSRSRTP
jgi:hypothetical protein